MSDEIKSPEKPFEYPMMPVFDMGIGRELGSLDSRLARVEHDIQRLDAKTDIIYGKLDAKIEAVDRRVDKCLLAINRMDERIKSLADAHKADFQHLAEAHKADFQHLSDSIKSTRTLTLGILAAVIAGFILQFFFK